MKKTAIFGALTVAGLMAGAAGAATLDDVKARGKLNCGVSTGLAGFSNPDANGNWEGFDVAVCRAVAAAVLGDPQAVEFVPTTGKTRFTALASGEIDMLGTALHPGTRKALFALRRKMGVAFQHGALINSMSVLDNIELPLRQNTKLDRSTIRIMSRMKLEMMNLGGFEDYMPAQLSGGMLKRAGLARAVVMDPRILFFDEPSAGLDPVTAAELDGLILQLRDALKMTIIIVTHALESAVKIADRIMIVGNGGIRTIGTLEEISKSPDTYIQSLLERRTLEREVDGDAYLERLTANLDE